MSRHHNGQLLLPLALGTSGHKSHVFLYSDVSPWSFSGQASAMAFLVCILGALALQMPMSSSYEPLLVPAVQTPSPNSRSPPFVSVCCLMRLKMSLTLFFIFLLQQREMTALAFSAPAPLTLGRVGAR